MELPEILPGLPPKVEIWEREMCWRCTWINPDNGIVCATTNYTRKIDCQMCKTPRSLYRVLVVEGESRDHLLQRILVANGYTDWAGWLHLWCKRYSDPWKVGPPEAWMGWGIGPKPGSQKGAAPHGTHDRCTDGARGGKENTDTQNGRFFRRIDTGTL